MPTTIRKLLELLSRRERVQFALLVVVILLLALLETAGIASIMPFMAVVTNPDVIHSNRWLSWAYSYLGVESNEVFLIMLGTLVLGLLVFTNVTKAGVTWLTLGYQNRLIYSLARRLLAQYMARPYTFFLGRNTVELASNILNEVSRVVSGVLGPLTDVLTGTLVSLAILCLLVIVDPSVALAIVTVLGGAYTAVYLAARRKLAVISREQYDASRQKYRSAIEALGGIKDMKVLGREITFLRRYVFYAERHAHNNVLAGVIGQLPRYALEIVAFGGILLVVLHFIGQGRQASQMIPLLALYAFAGYRLLPAMQQLFAALTNLRFSVASLDAVHADLKGSRADNDDAEDRLRDIAAAPTMPFRQEIAFHDVWFKYDGASSAALHGISLEIAANSTIGLVGPTGCGKTTTVDVMLGLLAPSAGALVVDGVPVTGPRVAQWQRNIGYVPQSIYISDDTVARNIAFGVPDEEVDWVAVRRAAQVANLADFVETQLPDAYNTRIGERGVRLSGGQRQRIGIARALYRDPPVLILDEATSALDGITEEAVMDAVRGLARRKTIIIIAHRLTTVRDCDVIYQFDKGVICAKGTFNDLVRESAWFRQAAGM